MRKKHKKKVRYESLVGTNRKAADSVLKLKDLLKNNNWLSIDPGSNSAGWALWYGDTMLDSGLIEVKGSISERLHQLYAGIKPVRAVAVFVEKVRSSTGHIYLTWAAGVMVAAADAKHTVEIASQAWQKHAGPKHTKGDEEDAIAIGAYVVALTKSKDKT